MLTVNGPIIALLLLLRALLLDLISYPMHEAKIKRYLPALQYHQQSNVANL